MPKYRVIDNNRHGEGGEHMVTQAYEAVVASEAAQRFCRDHSFDAELECLNITEIETGKKYRCEIEVETIYHTHTTTEE